MTSLYAYIAGIIVCVLLSAFFSASEMSYSACSRVRLEHQRDNGDKKAGLAVRIREKFDDALSTILVGNNLVNIAASSLGSLAVMAVLSEKYAWLSTLIITVTVIIFGETIPKITAKKNATRFARSFARPVRFLMILFRPVTFVVVGLVNLITGLLPDAEEDDNDAAIEELHWEEILHTIDTSPFSRIPVYEDSVDHVIGILSLNRFLKAMIDQEKVEIRRLLLPTCYVYKTMKLPAVLSSLRNAQQHLAVVTDEYGGTLGVVSMEDVLEQLVGDIWDETDTVERDVVEQGNGVYELDGDMPISEFLELMDWDEDDFDFDSETVGGWCIEINNGFPNVNSVFAYENIEVQILEVTERRVRRILVKRAMQTDDN